MRGSNDTNLPLFPSRTFSTLAESYFSDLSLKQAQLAKNVYERHLSPLKGRAIAEVTKTDMEKICSDMAAKAVPAPEIVKTANLFKGILGRALADDGLEEGVLETEYVSRDMMSGPTHVVGPDRRGGTLQILRDIASTTKKMLETLESMAAGRSFGQEEAPGPVPAGMISLEEVYRRTGGYCGQ